METLNINSIFSKVFVLADAPGVILPVAVYVLAMALYAIIIFKFYRFIAGRDIFSLDLSGNDASRVPVLRDLLSLIGYVIKYILLFPAFAFLWFAALTVMLAFLSEDRALSTILILALATVSAIRVCAYYDEDLSRDLAKILPFAVLAIILIDTASWMFGHRWTFCDKSTNIGTPSFTIGCSWSLWNLPCASSTGYSGHSFLPRSAKNPS